MGFCRNTLLTIFARLASKGMGSAWAAGPAPEGQVRLWIDRSWPRHDGAYPRDLHEPLMSGLFGTQTVAEAGGHRLRRARSH